MNRINQLFNQHPTHILSVYFCAGSPTLDGTANVIRALQEKGIQMVEIGIPFSDPLADGPVIQQAANQALNNGMTLRKLFGQLADIRRDITIPLVFMGYLNPILQYGFEPFCQSCCECGIDGMIIPDLPFDEYERHYHPIVEKYGLKAIFLVTPETDEARIRRIDHVSDGFIYVVSSASITGTQDSFDQTKQRYFERLAAMQLRNPLLVGFGISNRVTREAADQYASGVIVGSKFVSLLAESEQPETAVDKLLQALAQ